MSAALRLAHDVFKTLDPTKVLVQPNGTYDRSGYNRRTLHEVRTALARRAGIATAHLVD